MADKVTKLHSWDNLNDTIYPVVTDECIPSTIARKSDLDGNVSTLKGEIEANTAKIEANTAKIEANTAKIEANTAKIGTKADNTAVNNLIARYNREAYQFLFAGVAITTQEEGASSFNPSVTFPDIVNATNITGLFSNAVVLTDIVLPDFKNAVSINPMFEVATDVNDWTLTFGNISSSFFNFLLGNRFTHLQAIKVAEGKTAKVTGANYNMFLGFKGTEIGAFDFSGCTGLFGTFYGCSNLKHLHATHFKASFDISASTQFEESDLVEIISNLDSVTTAQTLTMGETNLAKLTDEEKKVATDKGWTLA